MAYNIVVYTNVAYNNVFDNVAYNIVVYTNVAYNNVFDNNMVDRWHRADRMIASPAWWIWNLQKKSWAENDFHFYLYTDREILPNTGDNIYREV